MEIWGRKCLGRESPPKFWAVEAIGADQKPLPPTPPPLRRLVQDRPRSGDGFGPAGTARHVCPRGCFSHLQFGTAFLLMVAMASHLYTPDFVSGDGPVGLHRR